MELKDIKPVGYYNDAHGFLHDEFDKDCYCQGGCSMEPVYTAEQMKQAYMAGVDYGYEARESHEELLNTGEVQDV